MGSEEDGQGMSPAEASEATDQLTSLFIEKELTVWASGEREDGEGPLFLEQILAFDGEETIAYELPSTEAEESSLGQRWTQAMKIQHELVPASSVALLVHDGVVYLSRMTYPDAGPPGRGEVLRAPIPPPGQAFGDFERFNPAEELLNEKADGPYGEEAIEVVQHLNHDLLEKLNAWAMAERTEGDPPPEMFMYDGGPIWRHREVPATELGNPTLAERVEELRPELLGIAPAPGVMTFLHEGEYFFLMAASSAPDDVSVMLFRADIPPEGEPFGEREKVDISTL